VFYVGFVGLEVPTERRKKYNIWTVRASRKTDTGRTCPPGWWANLINVSSLSSVFSRGDEHHAKVKPFFSKPRPSFHPVSLVFPALHDPNSARTSCALMSSVIERSAYGIILPPFAL
jgi:hypothetical protein